MWLGPMWSQRNPDPESRRGHAKWSTLDTQGWMNQAKKKKVKKKRKKKRVQLFVEIQKIKLKKNPGAVPNSCFSATTWDKLQLQPSCPWSYFQGSSALTREQPPLDALSISTLGDTQTFLPGWGTILFAFFSGSVWWTTADCAKETWREGVGKLKEARWKGDHGSLGWLNKRLTSFDVSFFLIIRWSSACFAFWEMPLHFSLIKMACFLLANKLEEESYNNLQYIRQLLLCNDIK